MKPLIVIILATVLISNNVISQKKIALIVAVGEYPEGGRWRNLSSMNDLKYVKAALKKNGFMETNIDTLVNQQATKARMNLALDRLVANVSKGDIVFFQFSGHGQQIEDDNGDEADGYDEALIPYDAKAAYDPVSYNGQNHFRDDLLGEKLQQIRNKIGNTGSLLVLLDACYSGTATRGNEFAICRGDAHAFQSPGYEPKESINKTKENSGNGFLKIGNNNESNMIVISASSPNQMNYESKDMNQIGVGSLSYAFAKAVSNLNGGANYATLFQKIKSQIQANIPTQVPMIEGDINQEVFSGNFIKKEENFIIDKWSTNDSTFFINGGVLDNLVNGNNFKVYSNDTSLVSEGTIKQTGLFQSLGISQKPLKKGESYTIKFDGISYGNFSGTIFINNTDSKNKKASQIAKQIEYQIKQYSFLQVHSNADMMLELKQVKDGILINLVEKTDSIHYSKLINTADSLTTSDWQYFLEGIKRTIRIKYFRNITDGGVFSNDVTLQVIPSKPSTDAAGEIILKPSDEFAIKVANKGTMPLYFTILDLLPNNDIKVLIPDEADEPQDYIIRPGETKRVDGIQVDAITPKGKEFFKAIFSKVPIDLRAILNRKRTRGTAELQSFEKVVDDLFSENNKVKNTRSEISKVKVEELGILTAGFTIQY